MKKNNVGDDMFHKHSNITTNDDSTNVDVHFITKDLIFAKKDVKSHGFSFLFTRNPFLALNVTSITKIIFMFLLYR